VVPSDPEGHLASIHRRQDGHYRARWREHPGVPRRRSSSDEARPAAFGDWSARPLNQLILLIGSAVGAVDTGFRG
jgi:hypothetical protein